MIKIMMDKDIFNQVLYIGPQYKDHRGGIGAVLATYSQNIKSFKFIPTCDGNYSLIRNTFVFLKSLVLLLKKLIMDQSIKIAHLHGSSGGSFYRMYIIFIITKYVFRKKVVYHIHASGFHLFYDESNKFIKGRIKHILLKSDVVICLSDYWYRYINEHFETQRLVILNNPIEAPVDLGLINLKEEGKLNLLFLGIIGERKGIFDLLEILIRYYGELKDKLVLTIGGNGEVVRLKELISKYRIHECVKFVGWISGEKKLQLLSSCDVLVLPSYNEGLPISILEAMSYGKAILSTNVGGIPEIVKNSENGFLIEPGDMSQMKRCIDTLIKEPSLIQRMGQNSKEKVKDFLISNIIIDLKYIYNDIII